MGWVEEGIRILSYLTIVTRERSPLITGDFFFPRIFLEKPKLNRKVAMAAKNAEMMSFHASIPWNRYIDPAFIPIAIIAVA